MLITRQGFFPLGGFSQLGLSTRGAVVFNFQPEIGYPLNARHMTRTSVIITKMVRFYGKKSPCR